MADYAQWFASRGGKARAKALTAMIHLLALLALTLLPSPAQAQTGALPIFSVGDEWIFSTGLVRKVVKLDGDSVVISGYGNCLTRLVYLDKNLAFLKITRADGSPPDTDAGFYPVGNDWKLYEFPLEVGKEWNFGAKGLFFNYVNHYNYVCKVEAYEDVATKAGTFKAFRITRDISVRAGRPIGTRSKGFSWTTTEWFSPAAKTAVKWTSTNSSHRDWELTAYTVK
jgi:hypothetical protein